MKKAKAKPKAKAKAKAKKAKTKGSRVKDLPAKKVSAVRGGLPAVQASREAARPSTAPSIPSEGISMNYSKIQF
jgi:hypothetical protein